MIYPIADSAAAALAVLEANTAQMVAFLRSRSVFRLPSGFARTADEAAYALEADRSDILLDTSFGPVDYDTAQERNAAHRKLLSEGFVQTAATLAGRHAISLSFWRLSPPEVSTRAGKFPIAPGPVEALRYPHGYADTEKAAADAAACPVQRVSLAIGEPSEDRKTLVGIFGPYIRQGSAELVNRSLPGQQPKFNIRFTYLHLSGDPTGQLAETFRLRRLRDPRPEPGHHKVLEYVSQNPVRAEHSRSVSTHHSVSEVIEALAG